MVNRVADSILDEINRQITLAQEQDENKKKSQGKKKGEKRSDCNHHRLSSDFCNKRIAVLFTVLILSIHIQVKVLIFTLQKVILIIDKCCPGWKVGAFYLENATFASKNSLFCISSAKNFYFCLEMTLFAKLNKRLFCL